MSEIIFIGAPLLFIVIGALGALSFSSPKETEVQPLEAEVAAGMHAQKVAAMQSIAFAQPIDKVMDDALMGADEVTAEALVAEYEERLRKDRIAADRYLSNPTENSIWIN